MARRPAPVDPAQSKEGLWQSFREGASIMEDAMLQLNGEKLRTVNEEALREKFEEYYEIATFDPGSTWKQQTYDIFKQGALRMRPDISEVQIIREWKLYDAEQEELKRLEKERKDENKPPQTAAPAATTPAPKPTPAPSVPTGRPSAGGH